MKSSRYDTLANDRDNILQVMRKVAHAMTELPPSTVTTDWIEEETVADTLPGESSYDTATSSTSCIAKAKACRDLLAELINITYLVSDVSALENLYKGMQPLLLDMKPAVPNDKGLTLNSHNIPARKRNRGTKGY